MTLMGKLVSLTKSGLEKRVELSNITKGYVGMFEATTPSYPEIKIQQFIRNGSEVHLKLSRIDVTLKVNDRDLDRIEYTSDLETRHGLITKDMNIPPHELNFLIEYETTRLNQVISDFKEQSFLKIDTSGKIELQSRTTKIQKDVRGEITIKPSEWV